MRLVMALMAILAISPTSAASAASQSLKPFEFRGFIAGQPLAPDQMASCKVSEFGSTFCGNRDDRKVAGVEVYSVYITAANNRLSSVGIKSDPIFFQVLTNAFKEKYGPPCKTSAPMWTGEHLKSRPNPTLVWCFSSGKLTAKLHGALIDVSEIDYEDINRATMVKPKPTVDF